MCFYSFVCLSRLEFSEYILWILVTRKSLQLKHSSYVTTQLTETFDPFLTHFQRFDWKNLQFVQKNVKGFLQVTLS